MFVCLFVVDRSIMGHIRFLHTNGGIVRCITVCVLKFNGKL